MIPTPTPIRELPEELVEFNRERVKNHLAQSIFQLMDSYHLTRTQFAALLDKGKSRVSQLLSGDENLSAETLADILLVFGRTPYLRLGTNPHEIRFPVDEGAEGEAANVSSTAVTMASEIPPTYSFLEKYTASYKFETGPVVPRPMVKLG